jgi:hypothetical protein
MKHRVQELVDRTRGITFETRIPKGRKAESILNAENAEESLGLLLGELAIICACAKNSL